MDNKSKSKYSFLKIFFLSSFFTLGLSLFGTANAATPLQNTPMQLALSVYFGDDDGHHGSGWNQGWGHGPKQSSFFWTGWKNFYSHGKQCQSNCLVNKWGKVITCKSRCLH